MRVLVSGGNSNLGKAIRWRFEQAGYDVWYTVTDASKANGKHAIVVDLTEEKQVNEVFQDFGPVDVLVNNAGVFTEGHQDSLATELFDQVFDLNVRGLFFLTRALLKGIKEVDGSIVNISSMNALRPGFGTTAHYDASKGAVSAYTRSLAAETGLRVNAIAPGLIGCDRLEGTDLETYWKNHTVRQEMMKASELADTVLFLAQSRGIYGQTLLVDNGFMLR
ncbi:MAG: SDR family oxidoreductase [Sphaerochaetaceae bacterium]|nr:SDR family oxidoreductase [Sphaerochaetaceae bacterium]